MEGNCHGHKIELLLWCQTKTYKAAPPSSTQGTQAKNVFLCNKTQMAAYFSCLNRHLHVCPYHIYTYISLDSFFQLGPRERVRLVLHSSFSGRLLRKGKSFVETLMFYAFNTIQPKMNMIMLPTMLSTEGVNKLIQLCKWRYDLHKRWANMFLVLNHHLINLYLILGESWRTMPRDLFLTFRQFITQQFSAVRWNCWISFI